jgi:hypothetical protein
MGETAIIPFFDIVAAPGAVRGSRAKAGEAGDGEANEAKLLAEMTFGGTSADETVELTMGVLWTDTTWLSLGDEWDEVAGDAAKEGEPDMDTIWDWEWNVEEETEETAMVLLVRLELEIDEAAASPTALVKWLAIWGALEEAWLEGWVLLEAACTGVLELTPNGVVVLWILLDADAIVEYEESETTGLTRLEENPIVEPGVLDGLWGTGVEPVRDDAEGICTLLDPRWLMIELDVEDRMDVAAELTPEHEPKADWQPDEALQCSSVEPHQFSEEQQSPNWLPLHVRPPYLRPQRPLFDTGNEEGEGVDILLLEDTVLETRGVLLFADVDRQDPKLDWQPVKQCAELPPQYEYWLQQSPYGLPWHVCPPKSLPQRPSFKTGATGPFPLQVPKACWQFLAQ